VKDYLNLTIGHLLKLTNQEESFYATMSGLHVGASPNQHTNVIGILHLKFIVQATVELL
jgi:hypothetical protein